VTLKLTSSLLAIQFSETELIRGRAGAMNRGLGGLSQALCAEFVAFAQKVYENQRGGLIRRASVDT
jgi:hypothetical protein